MEKFAGDVDDEMDDDQNEVGRYINTKIPFSKDDVLLGWWSKHSLIFSALSSLLAKSLFGIPASSATFERVFNASGRVLEYRRQSLSSDVVDNVLLHNINKLNKTTWKADENSDFSSLSTIRYRTEQDEGYENRAPCRHLMVKSTENMENREEEKKQENIFVRNIFP